MNATQSIIVYRNPLEQKFWESGIFVSVFSGCATFFIVFWIGMKILDRFKFSYSPKRREYFEKAVILLAALAGFSTLSYLL